MTHKPDIPHYEKENLKIIFESIAIDGESYFVVSDNISGAHATGENFPDALESYCEALAGRWLSLKELDHTDGELDAIERTPVLMDLIKDGT